MQTTISLTGAVATLLNRDAMLNATASAGSTVLNIGDAYMDRGTNTVVVFAMGTPISVGTEPATVASIQSASTIAVTSNLIYDHPIYTPVFRLDHFDISTTFPTLTAPGTIRVGMEEVSFSSVDYASTHCRCWIDSRGDAYPHTEWAPVTDASFTVDAPATDSPIATYGVVEDVDYHHGAMDQNTLDLYAYEKLMAATQPQYGNVKLTGMDVWQDATYAHKKDITYYVDTATSFATVRFHVYTSTGTDSATGVYIGDTIQKTWWDIRFQTDVDASYYLATFGTQSATVWLKIKDPATGGATLSMYYGSPIAIDSTTSATPIGYTVATLGTWGAVSTATHSIGDRGYATVREGDLVTVIETDGASRNYNVSGMIYDQRAGTLTIDIGKPEEYGITQLAKPFRTLDIHSTQNL